MNLSIFNETVKQDQIVLQYEIKFKTMYMHDQTAYQTWYDKAKLVITVELQEKVNGAYLIQYQKFSWK